MSTTSQQTPATPALTDTELTHLATALTGYTTSAHPAYRAAAARTALDALASIKAHIWESAAAHLECTQHLEAAAILWSAQPYYAPRPATATIEQVRAVLAQLPETAATVHLTEDDRAALAAPTPANLDTCPVCADLTPETSNHTPYCSAFCQHIEQQKTHQARIRP